MDGWVAVRGFRVVRALRTGWGHPSTGSERAHYELGWNAGEGLRRVPSGALGMTEKTEGSETPLLGKVRETRAEE